MRLTPISRSVENISGDIDWAAFNERRAIIEAFKRHVDDRFELDPMHFLTKKNFTIG